MAQVIFSEVSPQPDLPQGTLFKDLRFWLSHKVPQRSRFIKDIRANGGEILPIEKHADIKIVDHAKKEALPGTFSYTFIEKSARNGVLEDLQDHRAGPPEGTVRSIGSTVQPPKGTRKKYTQDDDRILWNWVHENPQRGGGTDGNEIFKQLEAQHPQHPWQSWRDRWVKQLKGKPRPFPLPHNAPPTPPSDVPPAHNAQATATNPKTVGEPQKMSVSSKSDSIPFGEEDAEALMDNGARLLEIQPDNMTDYWDAWVRDYDRHYNHSVKEWQSFWETNIRPRFLKRMAKRTETIVTSSRKTEAMPPFKSSLSIKAYPKTRIPSRSPSYHPESPCTQSNPPIDQGKRGKARSTEASSALLGSQEDKRLPEELVAVTDDRVKRKHATLDKEIPSSSPPETMSTSKRQKRNETQHIREVASTPEVTPVRHGTRSSLPLIIGTENEEASDIEDDFGVDESPLGKQPSDTLSEPDCKTNNTQAIFKEHTQSIDFNVPPPDEDLDDRDLLLEDRDESIDYSVAPPAQGWDSEDSGADTSESELTATDIYDLRPARQQTQAILRGETVAPDFEIAEPEGGWDHVIPSSPPPIPSSPLAESEVSDVGGQTEAWINAHVSEGISIDHAIAALKCTNMDTDLAEEVLDLMGKNGELPQNKKGVWTEIDDENLGSTDARNIQKLELKHGKDSLEARWDFLRFYGAA